MSKTLIQFLVFLSVLPGISAKAEMMATLSATGPTVPVATQGNNLFLFWSAAHLKWVRYEGFEVSGTAMPIGCGATVEQACTGNIPGVTSHAVDTLYVRQEPFFYKDRLCEGDTTKFPSVATKYVMATDGIENQIFRGGDGKFYKTTGAAEYFYPLTEFVKNDLIGGDNYCYDYSQIWQVYQLDSKDNKWKKAIHAYYQIVAVPTLTWPFKVANPLKLSNPSPSPAPTTVR